MITRYSTVRFRIHRRRSARPATWRSPISAQQTIADFGAHFEQFQFSRALETAWALVGAVNKYIVENEPWALAEKHDSDSRARLGSILYTSAEALRVVTALVHPGIPDSSARIWRQLGLGDVQQLDLRELAWGQLRPGTRLEKVRRYFPRRQKRYRKDATDGGATLRREREARTLRKRRLRPPTNCAQT